MPKGILLHGPPGTGKTLLAKAVAHESGATFLSQSASSFIEMFAGLGAARIRRLFKEAREAAPAIVFIDELDAVGATRGSDVSGERDQTLNQLLVEMDGFDSQDNVVVMAASNLLEKLDKALLRPGRFDRQVYVPPPDRKGRIEILKVHTASKPLGQDVSLERVARHGSGLTGADLANLANEAAILAGRHKREFIVQADFDDALERVVAGLESRKIITDSEKQVIAWHEAGHAIASELLPSVDKVQKVSIVPRGKALGYTLNLPQEDRYLKSRQELIDYMKVLLAGRVAEQITFGRITTGASDDLKRVTAIARSMVYDYAMGTHIRSHQVPGDDFTVSEALRQIRDEEVQAIAEEAYRGAHRLLSDHRDLLDEVAERLLENEMIEREEIKEIMKAHREKHGRAIGERRLRSFKPRGSTRRRGARCGALRRPELGASTQIHSAPMFGLIDHIGVATDDLDASLALYEGSMEMPVAYRETVEEQGVEAVLLDVGDCHVELLSPLGPDTPVGKFLERKGPGLHHVAYRVDDINATLSQLADAGLELIDKEPRTGIR